jgi:hypothetical protein
MSETKQPRTAPVDPEDRERLGKVVAGGEARAEELVGIPKSTIARCLAALPVRNGTRIALRQALDELDEVDRG